MRTAFASGNPHGCVLLERFRGGGTRRGRGPSLGPSPAEGGAGRSVPQPENGSDFADMRIPRLLFLFVLAGAWSASAAADLRTRGKRTGSIGRTPAALAATTPKVVRASSFIFNKKHVSSPYHPTTLRRHYEQAATDKAAGEKFYQLLANYQDRDALVLGYKAASEAIRARDASMFNKLTYVQDAARTFEQAVGLDPQNPEIRFLRFSVESNLPAFLGLSKHVEEDKEALLSAALGHPKSGLDAEAFRTVRDFLVTRGHVSEGDAQRLAKVKE